MTAIRVFDRGAAVECGAISARQIGQLWGLGDIQIGDVIGTPPKLSYQRQHFAPPTLETVVAPRRIADKGALRVALDQLAEQDPLINVRQDDTRQEISVSLYGEVQKEVIQATLARDFGLDVSFRETTTICIERPVGTRRGRRDPSIRDTPVFRHDRAAHRTSRSRVGRAVRTRRRPSPPPPVHLQNEGPVCRGHDPVRLRHAARGLVRVAGDRLRRDDDRLRLLRGRRTHEARECHAAHHCGRLSQAHAVGPDARARAGQNGGVRTDRACGDRGPNGRSRRHSGGGDTGGRSHGISVTAGEPLGDRGAIPRRSGAGPSATAARPHRWRGDDRDDLWWLRAGARNPTDPSAHDRRTRVG